MKVYTRVIRPRQLREKPARDRGLVGGPPRAVRAREPRLFAKHDADLKHQCNGAQVYPMCARSEQQRPTGEDQQDCQVHRVPAEAIQPARYELLGRRPRRERALAYNVEVADAPEEEKDSGAEHRQPGDVKLRCSWPLEPRHRESDDAGQSQKRDERTPEHLSSGEVRLPTLNCSVSVSLITRCIPISSLAERS